MIAHRTIRFRISALAMILSAVFFAVVSILMSVVLRQQLTDNMDEGLRQRAQSVAATLVDAAPTQFSIDEDLLIQLLTPDGKVLGASLPLTGLGPIVALEPGLQTIHDVPGRNETFRVFTRVVQTINGPALLVVGLNFDDVTDPLKILSRLLLLIVPAVVVVLGGLTWWLAGRTLRPVDQMRAEVAQISDTNLGLRVREPGSGDEIDRLAHTMNATLDRLEDAVQRQRRFVADASHELRGPLTRIRTELEVDLARPELADPIATQRSVLHEAIGLQFLVDDLLQLARSDAGAIELGFETVDLDDVVLREARGLVERGRAHIDLRGVSAVQVVGDPGQLGRAVKNLLNNAERHARDTVTVTLDEANGRVRLSIADDGVGIPPELRDSIFERFARLDEARTRDAGGAGLGLPIARDIVVRHGGTLVLADGISTRFVLDLPAIPESNLVV